MKYLGVFIYILSIHIHYIIADFKSMLRDELIQSLEMAVGSMKSNTDFNTGENALYLDQLDQAVQTLKLSDNTDDDEKNLNIIFEKLKKLISANIGEDQQNNIKTLLQLLENVAKAAMKIGGGPNNVSDQSGNSTMPNPDRRPPDFNPGKPLPSTGQSEESTTPWNTIGITLVVMTAMILIFLGWYIVSKRRLKQRDVELIPNRSMSTHNYSEQSNKL